MTRGGYEFSRASEYNCLMDGKCGPNALAAEAPSSQIKN